MKELTEEEKKKNDLEETNKQMEEVKKNLTLIADKITAIEDETKKITEERKSDKVLDLLDSNGERKVVKTKADLYATEFLTEKMYYSLAKVIEPEEEGAEETAEPITIEESLLRTLEEDVKAALAAEEEAATTTKKKGK